MTPEDFQFVDKYRTLIKNGAIITRRMHLKMLLLVTKLQHEANNYKYSSQKWYANTITLESKNKSLNKSLNKLRKELKNEAYNCS